MSTLPFLTRSQGKANSIRSFTAKLFHQPNSSISNSPVGRPPSKPAFSTKTPSSDPEAAAVEGEDGGAPSSSPPALDSSVPSLSVLAVEEDDSSARTGKIRRGDEREERRRGGGREEGRDRERWKRGEKGGLEEEERRVERFLRLVLGLRAWSRPWGGFRRRTFDISRIIGNTHATSIP